MIRRPPRSTLDRASAASDVYKRQAQMRQGKLAGLDADLALRAASLAHRMKLPLADSVMLATAQAHGAVLWTQDSDFEGVDGVRFVRRASR